MPLFPLLYQDFFNVKSAPFGAKGDGSTDDTTAIQNAINAALATGNASATVYFPPGTYKCTSSLVCTSATGGAAGNGVILRGAGQHASRIFRSTNFVLVTFNGNGGPGSHPTAYGGMIDITLDGNGSTTSALLQTNSAQQMFFRGCSFVGVNDLACDLNTMQDSYFEQCTFNNCGSTTQPVISIYGSANGTSNMLWFSQCRIESFFNGAIWIKRGAGATGGGNNGFFFNQLKVETGTVHGDFIVCDSYTQQLCIDKAFFSFNAFDTGYSTPAYGVVFGNAAAASGQNMASFQNIFVNSATTTITEAAIYVNDTAGDMNGVIKIDNVYANNTPHTSIIKINGATNLTFNYGQVAGASPIFGGDGSGQTNAIPTNTKVSGTFEATGALTADAGITSTGGTNTFKDTHFDISGTTTGSPLYCGFYNWSTGNAAIFQLGDPLESFQVAYGGSVQIQGFHMLELSGGRTTGTALSFRTGTVNGVGLDAYSVIFTNDQVGTPNVAIQAFASQTAHILDLLNSAGTVLVGFDASGNIVSTTTGIKIATATSQKLGFYNASPVAQQAGTGQTTGYTDSGATVVHSAGTFTGGVGSTAYTIGDIVKALKNLGLMAS